MDYPQRNTDAAKKIWIGKRECGFRARETVAADEGLLSSDSKERK